MCRQELPDGFFHVTTRGVNEERIYRTDADRVLFLRLLAETTARNSWRCHAFCLMGTHYHLVLETTVARLSQGLHRLNGVYAQLFNRRHARCGHLFGDRFHAWVIADETISPLRAATCSRIPSAPACVPPADDWPWSAVGQR